MNNQDSTARTTKGRAPRWIRLVGGGVAGLVVSFVASAAMPPAMFGGDGSPDPSSFQLIAFLFSICSFAIALILLLMSFSQKLYESENWTPESGDEEHAQMAPQLRISALYMIALSAQFGVLYFPPTSSMVGTVVAVTFAAVTVQLWTGWLAWRDGDELLRAVTLEGSALGLGVVFVAVSLWVPLAVYGVVGFDPLAMLLLVALACIVPTIWITVRRGMTS